MTLIKAIKEHMGGKRIKVILEENIENVPLGDLEVLVEMGAEFREFETIPGKPKEPIQTAETEKVRVKPSDSQLLNWRGQGMTYKDIFEKCGFAVGTVHNWLARIESEEVEDIAKDIIAGGE